MITCYFVLLVLADLSLKIALLETQKPYIYSNNHEFLFNISLSLGLFVYLYIIISLNFDYLEKAYYLIKKIFKKIIKMIKNYLRDYKMFIQYITYKF